MRVKVRKMGEGFAKCKSSVFILSRVNTEVSLLSGMATFLHIKRAALSRMVWKPNGLIQQGGW